MGFTATTAAVAHKLMEARDEGRFSACSGGLPPPASGSSTIWASPHSPVPARYSVPMIEGLDQRRHSEPPGAMAGMTVAIRQLPQV